MSDLPSIYEKKETYSNLRLNELRNRIRELDAVNGFSNLTIFGAGSYARLEASQYSDIDVFFLCKGQQNDLPEPRTSQLRLFGQLIDLVRTMGFPKFSNDCQFLNVLYADDMFRNLGSPQDDHENTFTSRMLLLLESKCLFGEDVYREMVEDVVESYYRDYPDHRLTFQPIFLTNDICRYWKTLLLNYEHKRNDDSEEAKTKQKVKNFKLKFSRMTTCFASIASLGSYRAPVQKEDVVSQVYMTPRQRLEAIGERVPEARTQLDELLERYAWFLELTEHPTSELQEHFSDSQKRTQMFEMANKYGDSMYALLKAIDPDTGSNGLLRYLVI